MAEKNYEEMQALFVSKPVDQSKTLGELYEELQKKHVAVRAYAVSLQID